MADIKKEEEKTEEIETTVKCENCGKTLYKNELCQCQRTKIPKWMPDLKKEIPLEEREY